jgi:hypothetical protein
MKQHLLDLLRNSTGPIASGPPTGLSREGRAGELAEVLSHRNGFYAFNDALHVFPATLDAIEAMTVQKWNADDLWRHDYGELVAGHLFFAEDLFGGQFSIAGERVVSFDSETGEVAVVAESIDEWLARLCGEDGDVLTGRILADKWREAHGPLRQGQRLVPFQPFVLGGDFSIDNLKAMDSVDAMRARGPIAQQLKEIPDGTELELRARGNA